MIAGQQACHLDEIGIWCYIPYAFYFCFVDMTVGEMLEQVFESKNIEFFLQQIGTQRSHAFQVLDGIV